MKFVVYHGADWEADCGFKVASGRIFLIIAQRFQGIRPVSCLVEVTGETISRRDENGQDAMVFKAYERPMKDGDLEYLLRLAEGTEHFVITNRAIIKALGMKFTKLERPDITRILRNRVFALLK